MSSLILRPLFVFLTLAMLVVAFFQVTGRLMFTVLDELEVGVNQWLAPQQIVLEGLSGDWRGINPVLRVARISLPAGELEGLHVELDWLESLIRNRLVARHVSLDAGHLDLERGARGWQLLGTDGAGTFDPFSTLYHSDQIDVALKLGFVGEDGTADEADDLAVAYRSINRGGAHRHRLVIRNAACESGCAVDLAIDEREPVLFLRQRQLQARVSGTGLIIPEPLLVGDGGRIAELSGHWWRTGDASGGEASVAIADLTIDDGSLSGGFALAARGDGDVHHLELTGLHVENGDNQWSLPGFWLTFDDREEVSTLMAWTERVDTGTGFEFVTALAPRETAVFRWLNALKVRATALNVHAFVRFPTLETGYLATVRDVALEGFNGAPWIRGAAGELLGTNRLMQLSINSDALGVQFPDMFRQRWLMDHLSGRLVAFISGDHFGLRGSNLRAKIDGTQASGGFALTRPRDAQYRERLGLLINVDQITVAEGKSFIPYRLPAGLPEWLDDGPKAGNLTEVAVAYHGQIHTRPVELARRVAFSARIDAGQVRYHPDWPEVRALAGEIGVEGTDVRIDVARGTSLTDTDLSGSRILLSDNAAVADIGLRSTSTIPEALAFIRQTPLQDWLSFVSPDWAGAGPVSMAGRLRVPLTMGGEDVDGAVGEGAAEDVLEVDLDIDLAGADLDLPEYGVLLQALEGAVHYRYPYDISGSDVQGRIFDRPAVFAARSDADSVVFTVDGQAPYADVLSLLEVRDPGVLYGGFSFVADLHIELGDAVSRLDVLTDLTGLGVELPGEFAKAPDDPVPAEVELRFLDDYQSLRFRYGSARGWLHVKETPLRGAIGFAAPPPVIDTASDRLMVGGRIEGFSIDELMPGEGEGNGWAMPIPVTLTGLEVGTIDVNGVLFRDARLDGEIGAGAALDLDLAVVSPDLVGSLRLLGDEPIALDLDVLRLPASQSPEASDPFAVDIIDELVDADITVGLLEVGETSYGSWAFRLRPEPEGLALLDLAAELRGVRIISDRLFWDRATNRSRFVGSLLADDLALVLPQWGYAASVSTERAFMEADLNWPGSPAAMDLTRLVGTASFAAEEGRFLEVTQGADAMKIFSLVNFTKIAKRLNFDFSDVVGEGVSFDSLTATTEFQEGTMQFLEPMTVEGSGSNFRVAGRVDLVEGRLDNEMIVTLPVSKGLPWYAAYVALANPLAGLGVLVGERVLRKPLEQFSSAKYEISGTLEDPELKFVSVWDTSMDKPQVSLERIEPETGDGQAPVEADEAEAVLDVEPTEDQQESTGTTT